MEAKGGEVRRLHIIYFLSRMGRLEQPHLIRLHHQARSGVYLRDVKRWLAELRGKDMPEAFAWSYKRKYKSGYVWQDLVDDDLITPISDNEYILKGSQINPTQIETDSPSKEKASILADEKSPQVEIADNKHQQPSLKEKAPSQRYPDKKTDAPRESISAISPDSLVFSSGESLLTLEMSSSKVDEDKLLGTGTHNPDEQSQAKFGNHSLPSLYHSLMSKLRKKSKRQSSKDDTNKDTTPDSSFSSSSSSSQSSFTMSKRYSSVFHNLIPCATIDTNDAVLVTTTRTDKNVLNKSNSKTDNVDENAKIDNLDETTRTSWIYHQQQQYGARKTCDGDRNENMQSQFAKCHTYKSLGDQFARSVGSHLIKRKCTST